MLPDIKNDLLHLLNILESCEKIILYSNNYKTVEEFFYANEQLNYNACLTLLSNICEIINKISNELKEKYKTIEWQKIKDFRNKIAHDYPGLDIYIVYKIIKEDIIILKNKIIEIMKEGLKKEIFDINEYNISKESSFYKNIRFEEIL
jgi:uncharacterized protein with HEPN domain